MQIQDEPIIPHVLIFPLPIQGPVNSMLKLAELLTITTNDIHVTFLTTDHVYNRLILGADAKARFHGHPRFSFHTFSDGLPKDHLRGGEKFMEMFESVKDVSKPLLEKLLGNCDPVNTLKSPAVTCVIADGLYDFAVDVGNGAGIPVLYFDTISPCCLWVYMCLPKLLAVGQVPIIRGNEDFDSLVNVVPGMESFLRRTFVGELTKAMKFEELL